MGPENDGPPLREFRDNFGPRAAWQPGDAGQNTTIGDPPYIPPPPFAPGYPVAPDFPAFPSVWDPAPIAMPPIPVYGFKFCAHTCDHCFCNKADEYLYDPENPHLRCCNCGIHKKKSVVEQGWDHDAFDSD